MGMSRRVYIALFAVLTELVAIAATGNQAVTNFVTDHMATSPLGDLFLRSLPIFPWRVTTESRSGAATVLVSQYAAIATFIVLTFALMLVVVRGALTVSEPVFASLCVVVTASLVAHMVGELVEYDQDGRLQHTGLGRFGYALFNSNNGLSIMFSLMCGVAVAVVVGVMAAVLRRRVAAEIERAMVAAAVGAPDGPGGFDQAFTPEAGYGPTGAPPWGSGYAVPGDVAATYPTQSVPVADDRTLADYGRAVRQRVVAYPDRAATVGFAYPSSPTERPESSGLGRADRCRRTDRSSRTRRCPRAGRCHRADRTDRADRISRAGRGRPLPAGAAIGAAPGVSADPGPLSVADAQDVIAVRRRLHAHPELAYHEVATTELIVERLRALGLAPSVLPGGTGGQL